MAAIKDYTHVEQITKDGASDDAVRAAAAEERGDKFYVTVKDGPRTGWLLGPYDSHTEALANVQRGKDLAYEGNSRAPWYAYGTASVDGIARTVFGR